MIESDPPSLTTHEGHFLSYSADLERKLSLFSLLTLALRPRLPLSGKPVPLFTDRLLGSYPPLGLVRGVLVGAGVAGGQAQGAEVVGGAGHRATGAASGHTATRSRSPSRAGMDRQMEWSSFQSGRSNKLSSERIIMPLITIHCKFNFICNNNQEPNTSL